MLALHCETRRCGPTALDRVLARKLIRLLRFETEVVAVELDVSRQAM